MIYIVINFWPIAAATLLGLAIGYAWLIASDMHRPSLGTLVGITLAEFWFASILAGALILAPPQASAWVMALGSAIVIWIGFVVPVLWVTFACLGTGTRQRLSAALHWLIVMLAQACVMQGIGLAKPLAGQTQCSVARIRPETVPQIVPHPSPKPAKAQPPIKPRRM